MLFRTRLIRGETFTGEMMPTQLGTTCQTMFVRERDEHLLGPQQHHVASGPSVRAGQKSHVEIVTADGGNVFGRPAFDEVDVHAGMLPVVPTTSGCPT